jgi:hypothetical protein
MMTIDDFEVRFFGEDGNLGPPQGLFDFLSDTGKHLFAHYPFSVSLYGHAGEASGIKQMALPEQLIRPGT